MTSRAKDTHTINRVVRLGDEWEQFGEVVGVRGRAEVIRAFVRWYLHYPGAKFPHRPPRPLATAAPVLQSADQPADR